LVRHGRRANLSNIAPRIQRKFRSTDAIWFALQIAPSPIGMAQTLSDGMTKASIIHSQGQARFSDLSRSIPQLLVIGVLILALGAVPARAQYRAIPDYIGIGAGQQFRNDINLEFPF
jgi:hypothetical protein